MAFVRTMACRMGHGVERADVSLALRKWWKNAYHHQNGLITQHLSPFEQKIIEPLFDHAPQKMMKYLKRWAIQIGPAFLLASVTFKWADHDYERRHREHWD